MEDQPTASSRFRPIIQYVLHLPARIAGAFAPGRVARIHLDEARERYLRLRSQLEYEKVRSEECADQERKRVIEKALGTLNDAGFLLTRRQSDLNVLWDELSRVHGMLLEILPIEELTSQIYFCREEARRLDVFKDPEVKEMLQTLAEATTDRPVEEYREGMIQSARPLIECFKRIRTERIHPKKKPAEDQRFYESSFWTRFAFGGVSRIHLYEAQERYLSLRRQLELEKARMEAAPPKEKGKELVIEKCLMTLQEARVLLTRRQNDLNFLWRELTRVHIMLLGILPDKELPFLVYFCREEARRLNVCQDPEVNEMLQRLAEATQDRDVEQYKDGMIRITRALIERFTTIRTGRIHQQFVNIRTYKRALVVLVPVLILLIANVRVLTIAPVEPRAIPAKPQCGWTWPGREHIWTTVVIDVPLNLWRTALCATKWAGYLMESNILFFVFLGGLAGGLMSVTLRLRDRQLIPGEDAYFAWYVLTKPFIGALGAIILFILLQGQLVDFQFLKGMTSQLKSIPSPLVFGFSFLAGFTERFVFPQFR